VSPRLLVVAKAPVPGRVKTRLGAEIGMAAAAELAAASLADTVATCTATYGAGHCFLAVEGSLEDAVDGALLRSLLEGWDVFAQRGAGLAERLVHAHVEVGGRAGGPVLQIGMDTPQVTPELLLDAAHHLRSSDALLGHADDGGWWLLGIHDPSRVEALADVAMSTSRTGADTQQALEDAGLTVATTTSLRDVDTVEDARQVAATAPGSRFAVAWAEVVRNLPGAARP
jgi:rSAM/selenodomain-associated transferase 1